MVLYGSHERAVCNTDVSFTAPALRLTSELIEEELGSAALERFDGD